MNEVIENFITEGLGGDNINSYESTDDYIELAKMGIIPRPLLSNDELYPVEPQKIIDSFVAAISQEGRYSFLSRESI